MFYIQRKDARQLETVDEFTTRKEARAMLTEYSMCDPDAQYYISGRPCADWGTDPLFEVAKLGPRAGELVHLDIGVTACIRDNVAPRNYIRTGYGKKMPTAYRVRTIDQRWRRVYVACYSNGGTTYVMHGKARTIVNLPV